MRAAEFYSAESVLGRIAESSGFRNPLGAQARGPCSAPRHSLRIDRVARSPFDMVMRFTCAVAFLLSVSSVAGADTEQRKFPLALNPDFQFRKAKIYTLSLGLPATKGQKGNTPSTLTKKASSKSSSVVQEASINFERSYRMYGAVTALDQRQRFGQYFDFFWRARRASGLTVRFEYKQEKLRAFVQAKEQAYQNVHGTNRSEFQVVGDEDFYDGQVVALRCLLIEHGRIVAEKRSFLWD